jgi:ribosomal protein S6--L-glutamate ligase
LFVNSKDGFWEAVERLGGLPVVVKQVSARQGSGVILFDTINSAALSIEDYLDRRSGLLIQSFIPPAGRKDIRAMVIGGEVSGAIELKPIEGDFRANFHLSGESYPKDLAPDIEEMAVKAASVVGLEIGGVDVIVNKNNRAYVIEVNYSPGFKGMEAATGTDIAGKIIDYTVRTYRKKRN